MAKLFYIYKDRKQDINNVIVINTIVVKTLHIIILKLLKLQYLIRLHTKCHIYVMACLSVSVPLLKY